MDRHFACDGTKRRCRSSIARTVVAPIAFAALVAASPASADPQDWGRASDIARNVLVGAAIAGPFAQEDWNGGFQAGGSMAAASAATYVLKHAIGEERPDHSDRLSFPSGHTSISFAAAASIEERYGWEAGVPALLLAGFVGVARVKANRHHVHDVIAGAVLGTAAGLLLTSKRPEAGLPGSPHPVRMDHGISVAFHF